MMTTQKQIQRYIENKIARLQNEIAGNDIWLRTPPTTASEAARTLQILNDNERYTYGIELLKEIEELLADAEDAE